MRYITLFEIDLGLTPFFILLIPISIIIVAIVSMRVIKLYGFKHPLDSIHLSPIIKSSNYVRFISFLSAGFGVIVLITILIKLPSKIIERKMILSAIESGEIKTIEGRICDLKTTSDLQGDFESFNIDGVDFKYSANDDSYGYHRTSNQDGLIKQNDQLIRISYCNSDGGKIILKIEAIENY
jgi:hypothetical protein